MPRDPIVRSRASRGRRGTWLVRTEGFHKQSPCFRIVREAQTRLCRRSPRITDAVVPQEPLDRPRARAEEARESRIHLPRLPSNAATILRLLMRPLEPAARPEPHAALASGNPQLEPYTNLDRAAPSDHKANRKPPFAPGKSTRPSSTRAKGGFDVNISISRSVSAVEGSIDC